MILTELNYDIDISTHDIDYVEYVGPGLTWVSIFSTGVI